MWNAIHRRKMMAILTSVSCGTLHDGKAPAKRKHKNNATTTAYGGSSVTSHSRRATSAPSITPRSGLRVSLYECVFPLLQ
jgi:hypothetical protein